MSSESASDLAAALIGELSLRPEFADELRDDPAAALRSIGFEPTPEALERVTDADWVTATQQDAVLSQPRGGI